MHVRWAQFSRNVTIPSLNLFRLHLTITSPVRYTVHVSFAPIFKLTDLWFILVLFKRVPIVRIGVNLTQISREGRNACCVLVELHASVF